MNHPRWAAPVSRAKCVMVTYPSDVIDGRLRLTDDMT